MTKKNEQDEQLKANKLTQKEFEETLGVDQDEQAMNGLYGMLETKRENNL